MKPSDPLERLLGRWQPQSPHAAPKFVNDTMRRIRQGEGDTFWEHCLRRWDAFVGNWMPSPNALVPIAASIILVVSSVFWIRIDDESKRMAAQRWQDQVNRPLSETSLTGSYVSLSELEEL